MIQQTQTVACDLPRLRRLAAFVELTKPRLVSMILVTTTVGFYLGSWLVLDYTLLLHTLIGTALAGGGTLALNQLMECEADALMERTRTRPLPDGRLQPLDALVFGAALTIIGLLYLMLLVNPLSALVHGLYHYQLFVRLHSAEEENLLMRDCGRYSRRSPPGHRLGRSQ